MDFQHTERFSNRVEQYVKHRPSYPDEVIGFFRAELGLAPSSIVADVGSGTGKLSELFLREGQQVWGVEPNRQMREAAERLLKDYPNFKSINGTAEATTLETHSVDFAVVAQAFHWFDVEKAKAEFARILKPGSWTALVWNNRRRDSTPYLIAYEQLLQNFGTDYVEVSRRNLDTEACRKFFAPAGYSLKVFENQQVLDYESLEGRLLSASYVPVAGHPNHQPMIEELRKIFDKFQENGTVNFDYDTEIYYGHVV